MYLNAVTQDSSCLQKSQRIADKSEVRADQDHIVQNTMLQNILRN